MRLSVLSLQVALLLVACNAAPVYRELLIEARDDLSSLDVRNEDFAEDGIVGRAYPGPGMRHERESNPPKTGFHPVPHDQYFHTATNTYSGKQVNDAAKEMLHSLHGAPPYQAREKYKLKTYPKPGTGFRDSDHGNPAPNDGTNVAYHAPITGQGTGNVGPDRVIGYKKAGDEKHTIGVSYHDPDKPIPRNSRNHPFSMAQGGRK